MKLNRRSGAKTRAHSSGPEYRRGGPKSTDLTWPPLLAHWKLNGNCQDSAGSHHGVGHGVRFVRGRDGKSGGAALFNGEGAYIEVPHAETLPSGTRDFSIALWVNLSGDITSVVGNVMSKYDAPRRTGFNFAICGSSPGYSGMSDAKNVHFGIDSAVCGSWGDCGKPWKTNPLIGTLIVYKGSLYTGIADASRPEDACHVFRYAGDAEWIDCGRLGNDPLTPAVFSVAVHRGSLYAGTGQWDWFRARAGVAGLNHVYRYEGEKDWNDCGQFGNGYRVMSLASFRGELYASDDQLKVYRYDGGQKWAYCGQLSDGSERLVNCVTSYRGHLYGSTHPSIYRYDGRTTWECIGKAPFGVTQVHKLQVYDAHLYAGTWPHGKVLRYEGHDQWTDCGQLGIATDQYQINEINDLTVYNGKLYAGVLPKAEVYRYEGGQDWTMLRRLVANPDWSPASLPTWCRITSMTVFQGRLFQGTSTCIGHYDPMAPPEAGRVFSMEAGKNVSYDDDLGTGWKHLVVTREGGRLKLYLNGELQGTSPTFDNSDYDITNTLPLLIGAGALNYFSGTLDDVRLYGGALSAAKVQDLYRKPSE
jgi:hypothetical protein